MVLSILKKGYLDFYPNCSNTNIKINVITIMTNICNTILLNKIIGSKVINHRVTQYYIVIGS